MPNCDIDNDEYRGSMGFIQPSITKREVVPNEHEEPTFSLTSNTFFCFRVLGALKVVIYGLLVLVAFVVGRYFRGF